VLSALWHRFAGQISQNVAGGYRPTIGGGLAVAAALVSALSGSRTTAGGGDGRNRAVGRVRPVAHAGLRLESASLFDRVGPGGNQGPGGIALTRFGRIATGRPIMGR
jgi:hypothetical protein